MAVTQLDSENADRDLTSQVAVLTDTPSGTLPTICQGYIAFGDGVKDLDGTGGDFELSITVGGQTIEPDPQTITFSTATRCGVWTTPFPVPANKEVILKAKSPNAGDSDVDVTAYLMEVSKVDVAYAGGSAIQQANGNFKVVDAGGSAVANEDKQDAIIAQNAIISGFIDTEIGTIISNIAALAGEVGTAGDGLTAVPWNASWDAEVQSEVQDALDAAITLPGQIAPSATPSIVTAIGFIYKKERNETRQTATTQTIYNDAGDTVDHKATVSDDGTTATRGKMGSGP